MTRTVLVTDFTWPTTEIEEGILAEVDARVVHAHAGTEDELVKLAADADAILTCFATVTPAVVRAGERLQVISRYGIGVDNIAVAEATRHSVPVTNVPAYCLVEVAEHTLALLLAHARSVVRYDRAVHAGNWSLATGAPLRRVSGRTLGVVGFGAIGQTVATRARALGLRILVHDPALGDRDLTPWDATACALDQLLGRSDFVTLHVPLTPDTTHLVDATFLNAMRADSLLLNTARGGLVDHDALAKALHEERIAGAAIDVFTPEHLPPDHPLLACPSLIATPHVAFYSEESINDLQRLAAQNVATALRGERPVNVVNPEVFDELRSGSERA